MKPFERKASSKYGSPTGRRDVPIPDGATVQLERVRLVDRDYDAGGAYWGGRGITDEQRAAGPNPLYCAWVEGGDGVRYFRAPFLAEATKVLLKVYATLTIMPPDVDDFTQAFIEAGLWSSTDESDESGGLPLDEQYSVSDLAPEALAAIVDDCARFQQENPLPEYGNRKYTAAAEKAGHDFWMTRTRSGVGFWDRDLPEEQAAALTKAAHAFGECSLYVGDDGKLYFS